MNDYIARVSERLAKTYAHEPEYLQCVHSWLEMIAPATEDPRYEKLDLISLDEYLKKISVTVAPEDPDDGGDEGGGDNGGDDGETPDPAA